MSSILEITKCDISNFIYYDNVTENGGRKLVERQKDLELKMLKNEVKERKSENL